MSGATQKVGALVGAVALVGLVAMAVSQSRRTEAAGKQAPIAAASAVTPAAVPAVAPATTPAGPVGPAEKPHVTFFKTPKAMPAFDITTFDGRHVTPASLRGKVVIVDFWATWCGPCREEIPSFIALQKKYPGELVVLGLSVDDVPNADALVRKFVTDHAMTYPVAIASDKVQDDFGGTPTLPMSLMVDREGKIVQKHVGVYGADDFELEVRALAGLPVNAVIDYADDPDQAAVDRAIATNTIPGIDLNGLTPDQRKTAIQRLTTEKCTCGCGQTIARCRVTDPTCDTSLPLAKKILQDVRGGGKNF